MMKIGGWNGKYFEMIKMKSSYFQTCQLYGSIPLESKSNSIPKIIEGTICKHSLNVVLWQNKRIMCSHLWLSEMENSVWKHNENL